MSTALVIDNPGAIERRAPSPVEILEAAVKGGITQESVAVVKELVAMCREQRAEEAKAAFAKSFFQLRRNMPEFYADKEAKNRTGETTFIYCSEQEITKRLEPHLMNYGFAMLFGQSEKDGKITVDITLMHELGHSETRSFTVRSGAPNAMKDAAMCDAGGATTAWRHLIIKMFGLKSRIQDSQDPRIEGSAITQAQAEELQSRVRDTASNEVAFLKFCGVTADGKPNLADYLKIMSGKYAGADELLRRKETNVGGKSGVAAPSGSAVPTAPDPTADSPVATAKTRVWMIDQLNDVPQFREWAIHAGWIMPNETLADVSLNKVPTNKAGIASLRALIEKWVGK